MTSQRVLRYAVWASAIVFLASAYRLSARHQGESWALLQTSLVFWTLSCSWFVIVVIKIIQWRAVLRHESRRTYGLIAGRPYDTKHQWNVKALRAGRWTITFFFIAAAYRLAIAHHDDALNITVATPEFLALICSLIMIIVVMSVERSLTDRDQNTKVGT